MSIAERASFINESIRKSGRVTLKQVAQRFEIDERTVKRTIEYMRDRIGAPVVYSRAENAYVYSTPFDGLEFADEKAVVFYTLIQKLSENHGLLPVVSEKLLARVREHISPEYLPLLDRISYEMDETEEFGMTGFRKVVQSILDRKRITFSYRDAHGRESLREAEPLHLICYSGHWYLAAFDRKRKEIRKFLFARMKDLSVLADSAENRISPAEIKKYLSGSFGIYKSAEAKTAVFRFYEPVYYLTKAQKWHRDQRTREGTDPGRGIFIEFSIPVGSFEEILGKILRYGDAAEAVSPPEFREAWIDAIRKLAERYL